MQQLAKKTVRVLGFFFAVSGLCCTLWGKDSAGVELVELLKDQYRLNYATLAPLAVSLSDQCSQSYTNQKVGGYDVFSFDEAWLHRSEWYQDDEKNLITEADGIIIRLEFAGYEIKETERSFLNFAYLKKALSHEYSEKTLSELSSDELGVLLPDLMLKINLLDGFTSCSIFEGKYVRGYGCYRSEDGYVYGQLWVSGVVFTYSIINQGRTEFPESMVEVFSKIKAISVESKDE